MSNIIFKKTLVIDVKCLFIFKTILYSQTSYGYVLGIPKIKGKNVKTNYVDDLDLVDVTQLDVSDFFEDKHGKINHLIND